MQVLQFWGDAHREAPIDVFVREPFAFVEKYARARVKPLHSIIPARFVSLHTLTAMNRHAGRLQDPADVDQLNLRVERLAMRDDSTDGVD